MRLAGDGRFPIAGPARQELEQRLGQGVAHGAERLLVLPLRALQRHVHRDGREHRVFDAPRLGGGAEHQVLERRRRQGRQAGVDAGGVGVELGTIIGGRGGHGLTGDVTEAVRAHGAIRIEGGRPDQRR